MLAVTQEDDNGDLGPVYFEGGSSEREELKDEWWAHLLK